MANAKQTVVKFGNDSPQHQENGVSVAHPFLQQSVTTAEMWPGFDDPAFVKLSLKTNNDRILTMIARGLDSKDQKYAVGVNEMEQIVAAHTGGASPSWIVCDDPAFQHVLAEHFGCPEGEPVALFTTVGRDAVHAQHLSTSQPLPFNYMAVTASVTAPAAGDTTLTGEIATAGGGLLRALAAYAHTAGTNTSTLTKTFTANGSDTLPVTLAQIGILNAATVGTLGYHTALGSTATLSAVGDNITVTWTDTAA